MVDFESGAVKRPGREKRRAKEHGVSLHVQLEHDAHSSNPSLRGAGELGLRFQAQARAHNGAAKRTIAGRNSK